MKWLLSLVLLAPASVAQGHVLVVDAAGAGAYVDIGTAILHAAPGDVLLVKSGTYAGFTVTQQSLTIAGDEYATVQINGTVFVRDLSAEDTVLLHRLQAFGAPNPSSSLALEGPGITLNHNTGPVRVQDCLAQSNANHPGILIGDSSDVALSATHSFGGSTWRDSAPGVLANGAALALFDCDVHGAPGANLPSLQPPWCSGGNAGSGLRSSLAGFLFVGGSLMAGGHGASGNDGCYGGYGYTDWCWGGNGGSGIDILVGAHTLWLRDDSLHLGQPGAGGSGHCGCGFRTECDGDSGIPGLPVASNAGDTVVNLAGLSPTLGFNTNPVRELTTLMLSIDSTPGDAVLLVACGSPTFVPETNRGVRLVDWNGPHFTQRLGTTDAQGHLLFFWAIPDLGPGVESQVAHLQALIVHPNGSLAWSNPVSLVMLDSAF